MGKLTLNKNPDKGKLTNSGTKELAKMRLISSIKTQLPFLTLFPINPIVLSSIEESITKNGYDNSQVLHIWVEKNVLIDGHTRLQASKNCSLKQIPVYEHSFNTEEEALEYAISLQRNRRNLTDAEMMSCLSQLDQLKKAGRPLASNEANSSKGKSAAITADLLGTSRSKVEKMRTITNHGTPEVLKEVSDGTSTINKAYVETVQVRKNKATKLSSLPSPPTHSNSKNNSKNSRPVPNDYKLEIDNNTIYLIGSNSIDDRSPLVTLFPDNPIFLDKSRDNILKVVHQHFTKLLNNYLLK